MLSRACTVVTLAIVWMFVLAAFTSGGCAEACATIAYFAIAGLILMLILRDIASGRRAR
jgi:hypothetical protein